MTNQYTTGQAVGMTSIPVKTIQRYIRLFPEGFSTSARQPDRGRRYTADDIKTLLLIRHLYSQRESPDRIHQAIAGEWEPEQTALHDLSDMMTIASAVRKDMTEIKGKIDEWRKYWPYRDAGIEAGRKRVQELTDIITDFERRLRFVEINMGLRKPPKESPAPAAPRKSFFGDLFGG